MAPNQLDILAAKSNYRILKKNLIQKLVIKIFIHQYAIS